MQENLPEAENRAGVEEWMEPERAPVNFRRREWLLFAALAALFAVCCWGFDAERIANGYLPGLGMALLVLALEGAALLYLGRRAKKDALAIAMLAFDALLAVAYFVYANPALRWLNLMLLIATLPTALFGLAGHCVRAFDGPGALFEGGLRAVHGAFVNMDKPFLAAGEALRGNHRRARGAILGLLIAAPVLLLAVVLLLSADPVFANLFAEIATAVLGDVPAFTLMRLGLTLLFSLIAFSMFYALRRERAELRTGENIKLRAPAAAVRLPLLLFNLVYALFVYVQFRNLFGGAETAAMTGGYAEYARSGFFQLAFVAALNLCVFGICRALCPDDRPVRVMLFLLVALTAVILVSAAWRMRLYVWAYGLSFLRMLTFLGMLAVALALAAALWKLVFPAQRVFRLLLIGWMAAWLLFNVADVDRVIANYDASHYLAGTLREADAEYLSMLSSGALGALEDLNDHGAPGAEEALKKMRERIDAPLSWADWSVYR